MDTLPRYGAPQRDESPLVTSPRRPGMFTVTTHVAQLEHDLRSLLLC